MRGEFVDIGGSRLYCYAAGSRGAGDPVVLVHGCFQSSFLWHEFLPRIPKGHRVLVLDLLGHGRSDPPYSEPMTVAAHAKRIAALLAVFGVKNATIVGHGTGAAIAMRVAFDAPECVGKLALVSPVLVGRTPQQANVSRRMRRIALLEPFWRRVSGGWLASALHAALLRGYAHRMSGARSLDVYLKNYRYSDGRDSACAQLRAISESVGDTKDCLNAGALNCQLSLIHGESDPYVTSKRIDSLKGELQLACSENISVHCISGAAHMIPEEAPDILGTHIAELLLRTSANTNNA